MNIDGCSITRVE
ncbi:hypothetical protein LINPERHAP1_LOCUS34832 [Linum perenne]